jgi:hypothetical protein
MSAVAAAVIGGVSAIGGALISSSAASSAADKQVQASREALAAQERADERRIALQEPFRQGGMAAQNRLMTLLGLNPNAGKPAVSGGGTPQTYQTPYGTFTVPAGGYGAASGYGGAPATDANGIVVDSNSPDFGKYARDFGMQDFQQDPGYAFRLSEGQKAIERSAAARGGLQSGSALKAAARFGQDLGSQEYKNAFSRYQTNRSNQLNPLFGLMNTGIGAANNLTDIAGQQGQNRADAINAQGTYSASGTVASGNAWGNAFNSIGKDIGNVFARSSTYGDMGRYGSLTSALDNTRLPTYGAPGVIDVGPTPYVPV